MKIKLTRIKWKDSSFYKKEVDVADNNCITKDCLHPHDYGYSSHTRQHVQRLMCLTRERGNCNGGL